MWSPLCYSGVELLAAVSNNCWRGSGVHSAGVVKVSVLI